jgi:hypothetical protein
MENISIEGTKYTPEIKSDIQKGEIKFYGSSYPENANEFYQPVYEWVEKFFERDSASLEVNFYIYYFNTSTSKCFMNLLEILENNHKKGKKITVNWHYSEDDEDSLDSGEKLFMEMDLNYKLIPVNKI